jgi:large subunit ribosomal protein L17
MKHKIKGRKLNRTSSHRKSLLINLASALVRNEIIKTTLPKAKELRPFVEKLLTISKIDNLSNRRKLISAIKDKDLIKKLFSDIGPRVKDRNGGYTRIMHYGFRSGDKAPMAIIELVDRVNDTEDKSKVKSANEHSVVKSKNSNLADSSASVKNKNTSPKEDSSAKKDKKPNDNKSDKISKKIESVKKADLDVDNK